MKFDWVFSPGAQDLLGDWLRWLKCPDCGAIHNQEHWHYEDGEGFSLEISVDLCSRER